LAPLWGLIKLHARRALTARVDILSNIAFGVLLAYGLAFLWKALYQAEFKAAEIHEAGELGDRVGPWRHRR
jgi:hypothetical protein